MKSLQQVHFPVSTLHLPPVFAHLGSHGGGKGGCLVHPGFLQKKKTCFYLILIKAGYFNIYVEIVF